MGNISRGGAISEYLPKRQSFNFMGNDYFSEADSLEVLGNESTSLLAVAHYGDIALSVMRYRKLFEGTKIDPDKSSVNVTVSVSKDKEVETTHLDKFLNSHIGRIKNPFYARSVKRAITGAEKIAEELKLERFAGSLATVHKLHDN